MSIAQHSRVAVATGWWWFCRKAEQTRTAINVNCLDHTTSRKRQCLNIIILYPIIIWFIRPGYYAKVKWWENIYSTNRNVAKLMLFFLQRPSVCFSLQGILNDTTVGIFRNCRELRLRRATIRCCPVSLKAFLLALCPHRLQELDASWVSGGLTGANIISGLASNPECRSSLQRLSLDGLNLAWESLWGDGGTHVGFSSLQALRKLSLANTDLTDNVLEDVCSLPQLESLDISCSAVSKLTPLLDCKNTLRSLIAHHLRQLDMPPAGLLFVFSQLHALRHLDFSDDHLTLDDSDGSGGDEATRQLLEGSPDVLPSLVSLDISGRKRITEAAVRAFVESRSGLVFLGLLATGTSSCDVLCTQKNLKVSKDLWQSWCRTGLTYVSNFAFYSRLSLYMLWISLLSFLSPFHCWSALCVLVWSGSRRG